MSSPLKENRDAQLDELRGLAICAVLASHVALVFANDFALARVALLPALGVGVDLFFVISGYLIVERAARSVAKAGGFWRGAAAFWAGRVIRIGVPAWVTIGALYLAWRLGGLHGLRFEDLIAAAAFLGNFYWAPCFAGSEGCGDPLLSSHFWSLGIEAQFYALAPFLAALGPALAVDHRRLGPDGRGAAFAALGRVLVGAASRRAACRRPDRAGNAPARRVAEAHSENWPRACDLLAACRRGAGARPVDRRDGRRSGGGRRDLRDGRGGKRPGYAAPARPSAPSRCAG